MRLAFVALATLFVCSHANAQEQPAPPSAVELQAAQVISDLLTDSAFVEAAADAIVAARQDEFRRPLLTGSFYESLRPDTQRSLSAFVDTLPQIFREEITTAMAEIEVDFTRRLTQRFSEAELQTLATLFSHPEFRAAVFSRALGELRGEPTSDAPIDPELEALITSATYQGVRHWEVVRVFDESNAIVQLTTRPRVERRVLTGLCAALGDECPPHVQRRIAN